MSVVLIGSNPGVLLFDHDRPAAFASVWTVDWSRWGHGDVIVLATPGRWLTVGTDEHFARILADRFTRHFPEADGFEWTSKVVHVPERPSVRLNPASGVRVSAPGLRIEIGGVLDRRHVIEPSFVLGGSAVSLSNVYLPCARGTVTIDGVRVDGEPQVGGTDDRPSSSAYLALAEVWTDPQGSLGLPERPAEVDLTLARGRHLRSLGPG